MESIRHPVINQNATLMHRTCTHIEDTRQGQYVSRLQVWQCYGTDIVFKRATRNIMRTVALAVEPTVHILGNFYISSHCCDCLGKRYTHCL